MRNKPILKDIAFLMVWVIIMTTAARAGQSQRPSFTARETEIIQRNEILASVVRRDPSTVKQVLDLLKRADQSERPSSRFQRSLPHVSQGRKTGRPSESIDLSKNPDIDSLNRSSPEAALDLIRLLKQAGSKGKATAN